ncbi:LytR family transcriptional regulator [Actinomadura sp. KC216]|uniref:LCP family protein n=1 Tax=Actinomadura sp. KC216 TaxID=2530370 RepID=UPI00104AAC6C|nr:LCP family protein [Actinomadura sp. KC216]TDB83026.1 LytR family transcriptional regulator [Actinomadura sp. KC216]
MDDLELIRDFGRDLEHEPADSLLRQRDRLVDAATARGGRTPRGPRRWTLFGVLAAGAAAAVTATAILVPAALMDGRDGRRAATESPRPAAAKTMNVLVIGSDARRDGHQARSDTLVVVHVPADRKGVRAVSVPRDSLVDIPACRAASGEALPPRRGPINTAFGTGGAACARTTVESLTRIRIDQIVVIDFGGFRSMVDALGGVEITLRRPVVDPKAGLDLRAGTQRLDGRQALAYVRSRFGFGDGSDLSRIKRQQVFMAQVVRQARAMQSRNPVRFARFLAAAARSVEATPRWDLRGLEALARTFEKTGADDVEFGTVPVRPAPEDPNRLVWDPAGAERMFAPFRS